MLEETETPLSQNSVELARERLKPCFLKRGPQGIMPRSTQARQDGIFFYGLIMFAVILGDPGADKGGEGKSKRAEKYI